jgi:murein L,D-transpeptidase YcbB/YkuD
MNKILFIGLWLILTVPVNAQIFSGADSTKVKSIAIDSLFIQKFGNPLLNSFYKTNNNQAVWLKSATTRNFLLITLYSCAEDGLDPKEFECQKLAAYETKFDSLSNSELIEYDVLLTRKLQKYVAQLTNGKLSPKTLYRDWDLKENKTDINQVLASFIKGDSLSEKTQRLKPNHLVYKSLTKMLQLLNTFPEDTIKCIEVRKLINRREKNPALITIKQRLVYWKDLDASVHSDAVYDDKTFTAVKKFQLRHGLNPDGVIGYRTVEALNFSRNHRREQVIVNLERWKWFPRELGNHYIIVNIPEYNLKVVKNKDTIETKRIVVGQIARKTAVLSSTFNNIILNPTWTVPPTILLEDLLPAATKNRNYFASRNIVIYDYYNQVVSPYRWNPAKYKNYRYVQSPGDENSLGNVKFNFPNHYSVYLHDTNHRDYFVKNFRSLSSGCVRVENPLPLAQYMLNDPKNWSMEKICDVIFTKKTTVLALKEKINIHQLYWTAWMDADGTLEFRTDIYNLDDELYEKLRN